MPDSSARPILFSRLHDAITAGEFPVRVGGALGSSVALVAMAAADAAADAGRSVLCICPGADAAEGLAADLDYFTDHPPPGVTPIGNPARHFPGLTAVPTHDEPVPPATAQARLTFLTEALQAPHGREATDGAATLPFLGVTSVSALMQRLIPPEKLGRAHVPLVVGEETDPGKLVMTLVDAGFVQQPMVEWPGELSSRGGILDIFPHASANPWRIEFFGDEVTSIRAFDAATQASFRTLDRMDLLLAGDPAALHEADGGKLPKAASLLDYLPADTLLVLLEPNELAGRADLSRKSWTQRGAFRTGKTLREALQQRDRVEVFELAQGLGGTINLNTASVERYTGDPDSSADAIRQLAGEIGEVRVLARNTAEARRMRELLNARGVQLQPEVATASVTVDVGDVEEGFVCPEANLACLQHSELLQKVRRRRNFAEAVQRSEAINDFLELNPGDLVVHVSHGISRFVGMTTLARDDAEGDFLELEFDGGTRLHVPAVNVSLVQKYVGAGGITPELSKLGGKRWSAKKAAVEEAVLGMAGDFLRLQAERMAKPGVSVPPDDEMVHEFIAAFPYEETPDQERVDVEIREDMMRERPMDRLLCGDVGYGKTELAMRAACRAVAAGFQVAILVPTTVLAEQHYQTFSERFAPFPVTIDRLSRFRTPAESREIVRRATTGGLDILIGTHRLLSQDVAFAELGLVVIDEEQRFGVAHKERLKHLRRMVDVLTLTATPIPRTLHMSLLGIRDISSLSTPPHNRLAVHTEVTPFNNELVRHGILRELDRDGQVFFIHNRVYDIHTVARHIQTLAPEARVEYAHGQMPEGELQKVMERFVRREIDVLVSTTIVESGLDIPTANTLFVNRADRFGLAELHQLRGRVGRYRHKAYAYFMVEPDHSPSDIARRRLRAIAEFSHLGAGFGIAMRDLEIRGAGNIIGNEQSGHIAAVGYDLYCKLLQNAIHKLRKDEPDMPAEGLNLTMQLGTDLRIPTDYISDRRQRLDAYRKLFSVDSVDALHEAAADLRDRYGPPTPDVLRLLDASRLRLAAAPLGISAMRLAAGEGVWLTCANADRVYAALERFKWRTAVLDPSTVIIRIDNRDQRPSRLFPLLLTIFGANTDEQEAFMDKLKAQQV